jgi:hypothetical protein
VPGSGAWFLFSAEIAIYPGQVSWLRSGTFFLCRVSSFPGLKAEWIFGDSSSFTVAGPRRDLHRTSLFSPCGHLGSEYSCTTLFSYSAAGCFNGPACARSGRVRSTSRTGHQACPKAVTASPRTRSGTSRANWRGRLVVLHRSRAESSKT